MKKHVWTLLFILIAVVCSFLPPDSPDSDMLETRYVRDLDGNILYTGVFYVETVVHHVAIDVVRVLLIVSIFIEYVLICNKSVFIKTTKKISIIMIGIVAVSFIIVNFCCKETIYLHHTDEDWDEFGLKIKPSIVRVFDFRQW